MYFNEYFETLITPKSSQTSLQIRFISRICEKKAKNQVHWIQKSNKQQQRFMLATIHENSNEKCDINEIGSDYALQMNQKFSFFPFHSHSSLSGLFRSLFFTLKLIYDIRLSYYFSSLSSLLCVFLGALSSPYSSLCIFI